MKAWRGGRRNEKAEEISKIMKKYRIENINENGGVKSGESWRQPAISGISSKENNG
jgi:hypothetical protein